MLSFNEIQQAQGNMNREQLAQTAQAATIQPTVPPPAVMSSARAQTATTNNLNTLKQAEQLFTQPSADPLQQVYSKRSDLQSLYDPQGQAKNINDPRVAGIPTLTDWAKQYGQKEEPMLAGMFLQPMSHNNPAGMKVVDRVNELIKQVSSSGQPLSMEDQAYLSAINSLSSNELSSLASARSAADEKNYTQLNTIMTELSDIRKNRDKLLADLYSRMNQTADEVRLQQQLSGLEKQESDVNLRSQAGLNELSKEQIPLKFIKGEQMELLKAANLQLQTVAAEKAPIVDQLKLAQQTRQDQMDALKTAIEVSGGDEQMLFQISEFARELESTVKSEQEAAKTFAINNHIQTPFYLLGGTVYETSTGQGIPTPQSFFQKSGVQSFEEAYQKGLLSDYTPKPVELSSGERLVDPTTGQTIADAQYKTTNSGSRSTTSPATKPPTAQDASIRNWVLKNKQANPDVSWFDLWGQLADELQRQGINPANYDDIFWELLHPEGTEGYKREQQKKKSTTKASEGDDLDALINSALQQSGIK